jgi:plastocyanin
MNRVSRATRLLLVIAVSGIAFFGPVPAARADKGVRIWEENPNKAATWRYDPADITVKVGETVTWEWVADDKHSVTSDNGAFDSGEKKGRGTKWSFKFTKAGDFPYSCTPHPFMVGSVKVQ